MEMINRSAVILKPLEPYLEWTRQDDEEGLAESVFESMRDEPHVHLLPEYEDDRAQQRVLRKYWPILFEAMLFGWVTDEAYWPKNRTLRMFRKWFEIQMCSVVEDLAVDEALSTI